MSNKKSITQNHSTPSLEGKVRGGSSLSLILFFLLAWLWASWWMGDVLRIAYERSFFAPDSTLILWLWQKKLGWLWVAGRALLTLYHWPVVGGLLVALLLTFGSWLTGRCLRLPSRLLWLRYVPATAWMVWTAHVGLNLYYMREPGRILGVPFAYVAALALIALALRLFTGKPHTRSVASWRWAVGEALFVVLCFGLSVWHLESRHPWMRTLTHIQVQLLNEDYEGMVATAHEHPDLCNRHFAGYYAIALARTGQLADRLFDIRLDFDSIRARDYFDQPSQCLNYHVVDCDYHAGLYRPARHYVMEDMTMAGPSLFSLKYLAKMALLDGDWALARKYFHVLHNAPFEGDFLRRFEPLVGHKKLVEADPELGAVLAMAPPLHTFEQFHLKPAFLGYYANLKAFKNEEALTWSIMANLYAKRMPDFLQRCGKLVGSPLPRSIAEGLTIAATKEPGVLKAFPQLETMMNTLEFFINDATPYMQDRAAGGDALFEKYKGYYPYYYFFGNIRNARQPGDDEQRQNNAGVN